MERNPMKECALSIGDELAPCNNLRSMMLGQVLVDDAKKPVECATPPEKGKREKKEHVPFQRTK